MYSILLLVITFLLVITYVHEMFGGDSASRSFWRWFSLKIILGELLDQWEFSGCTQNEPTPCWVKFWCQGQSFVGLGCSLFASAETPKKLKGLFYIAHFFLSYFPLCTIEYHLFELHCLHICLQNQFRSAKHTGLVQAYFLNTEFSTVILLRYLFIQKHFRVHTNQFLKYLFFSLTTCIQFYSLW